MPFDRCAGSGAQARQTHSLVMRHHLRVCGARLQHSLSRHDFRCSSANGQRYFRTPAAGGSASPRATPTRKDRQLLTPNDSGYQVEGGEELKTLSIIASCNSAPVLQSVEGSLDQVSSSVQSTVVFPGFSDIGLGRYDCYRPLIPRKCQQLVAFVPLVGYHPASLNAGKRGYGLGSIRFLTSGVGKAQGLSPSIGHQMYFGAQSSPRTPRD